MSKLLDILFRRQVAPVAPAADIKRLAAAQKEATAIAIRKALLAREVQATIARIQRQQ